MAQYYHQATQSRPLSRNVAVLLHLAMQKCDSRSSLEGRGSLRLPRLSMASSDLVSM